MDYTTDMQERNNEIGARQYNIAIGGLLTYGFAITALVCYAIDTLFIGINPVIILMVSFIGVLVASFLNCTFNIVVKFIAYNLYVISIGCMLHTGLQMADIDIIIIALVITAIITLIMLVIAALKPEFFINLGRVLLVSLIASVIVELVMMLFGIYKPTIVDGLVIIIFSLYIGFDWVEAQNRPKTYMDALDTCLDLYADITALIMRLVEILSYMNNDGDDSDRKSRGRG